MYMYWRFGRYGSGVSLLTNAWHTPLQMDYNIDMSMCTNTVRVSRSGSSSGCICCCIHRQSTMRQDLQGHWNPSQPRHEKLRHSLGTRSTTRHMSSRNASEIFASSASSSDIPAFPASSESSPSCNTHTKRSCQHHATLRTSSKSGVAKISGQRTRNPSIYA